MGQQVLANDLLSGVDLPVREHAESGEQFRGQIREFRGLTCGVLGVVARPVIRNSTSSARQLAGSDGFRLTARKKASMAGSADRIAT